MPAGGIDKTGGYDPKPAHNSIYTVLVGQLLENPRDFSRTYGNITWSGAPPNTHKTSFMSVIEKYRPKMPESPIWRVYLNYLSGHPKLLIWTPKITKGLFST